MVGSQICMRSSGGRSKDSVQERLGVGTARATLALTHRRATQSRASCGAPARARRGKRMGRAQQQRPLQPQRRRQQQHRRQKQPHQDQCPQTDIRIFVPAVAAPTRARAHTPISRNTNSCVHFKLTNASGTNNNANGSGHNNNDGINNTTNTNANKLTYESLFQRWRRKPAHHTNIHNIPNAHREARTAT